MILETVYAIDNKIREVGIVNTVKGTIKREKYKKLSRKYDFPEGYDGAHCFFL